MNNQPGNCSEEIYSVIVMPFFLEKKVKGFLYLENKQIKDLFTEKDIEILSMIAGQIALILEKSYLPLGKIQEKAENTDHKNLIEKYEITQREKEIIDLLLEGKTNKAISKELFLSFYTVKTHIYNIYRKTAVKNRVELTNLFGSK
jgi:DNA-binding NarL/FixJ family response regulator